MSENIIKPQNCSSEILEKGCTDKELERKNAIILSLIKKYEENITDKNDVQTNLHTVR